VNAVDHLVEKVAAGGRLTDGDVAALASSHDLIVLGMLGDEARRRRHADRVTFVRVAAVPLAGGGEGVGWASAGEVRICGTPSTLQEALAAVNRWVPQAGRAPLSGFCLADLEALAGRDATNLRAACAALREAGLQLVAEAAIDRLADPVRAVAAAREAGLDVLRVTVAGSVVQPSLDLFRAVSSLQWSVGGVRAFAPLPVVAAVQPSTGYDDVKQVALARLVVDGIESIQVDWTLYGPKLAQVALTMGADDVDGVSATTAPELGPRRAPLEEIRRNIRAASLVPVERDARFRELIR
jgi:aminodeoxyfutalosine synthase